MRRSKPTGCQILAKDSIRGMGLSNKIERYLDYGEGEAFPFASVVVVTYNSNKPLLDQCLTSLKQQTFRGFESIIVDNSDKVDLKPIVSRYACRHVKLKNNYGLSIARNVGTSLAKGDIVIFLDDDAIPALDFVEEHMRAHNEYDIAGLRGKSLYRTSSAYNHLASHYDLGDHAMPWPLDLEGNSSFKRDILIEVGGFDSRIAGAGGYEGLALTHKIVGRFGDKSKIIYYPKAVIYHDYCTSLLGFLRKRLRHAKYSGVLMRDCPKFWEIVKGYQANPEWLKKASPSSSVRMQLILVRILRRIILEMRLVVKGGWPTFFRRVR